MASTITIPKTEYQRLHRAAQRYELVRRVLFQDLFAGPETRNVKKIVSDFRKIKRYSPAFLKSLERGLKESDYFASPRRKK